MIYLVLFLTFFKIGAFTIGGGYAMLPMIQQEVESHGWMSQGDLVDFIAVSEATPGPFAINISTYVGAETGGFPGAVSATLGVTLPSFLIMLLIFRIYTRFQESFLVRGIMKGLRPAVVGLIGAAMISVGAEVFFPEGMEAFTPDPAFWFSLAVFALGCILEWKKLHPILLLLLSAGLGIAAGYGCLLD